LFGFLLGKFKQDLLSDQILAMNADIQVLKSVNERLDTELGRLQIKEASEQQTIKALLQSNKQLEDDLSVANNKLFFYERIVSPELEKKGVQVYSFEVTKNNLTELWDYQLVLMQSKEGRRLLKGKVTITLSVFEDNNLKQIKLSELEKNNTDSFKFKYFQTLQGAFALPENVTVDEVIINVTVPGNRWYRSQKLEERHEWRVLTTKDSSNLSEFDN